MLCVRVESLRCRDLEHFGMVESWVWQVCVCCVFEGCCVWVWKLRDVCGYTYVRLRDVCVCVCVCVLHVGAEVEGCLCCCVWVLRLRDMCEYVRLREMCGWCMCVVCCVLCVKVERVPCVLCVRVAVAYATLPYPVLIHCME